MKILITYLIFTLSFNLYSEESPDQFKYYDITTVVERVTYKATVYEPKKSIKAIVIVSPTIAGIKSLEVANAQFFSKNGFLALIPHPFYTELNSPTPDTKKLDADYFRPVYSVESLVNVIEQKLQISNSLPIFALGASQGAMTSMILASHYPRIRALWASVGGGDLPYIYAYSKSEAITLFRTNHMKTLGLTDPSLYEAYLRANLQNDPAKSCKSMTIPYHQTIATRDDVVPTKTQEHLVDECPPHEVLRKSLNHTSGTLTNVLMQEEIKVFFESAI